MVFYTNPKEKAFKTFGCFKNLLYLCNVKSNGNITMEETIKGIEVIAYKGMGSNMTCRGFQYEIGKTYKTDKAELCKCGFHACLNPIDVLGYYYYSKETKSRYFKVKLSGEITKCDEFDAKVAATEITILEEININEVIETTEWWKNENVLDLLYYSEGFARVRKGYCLWNFINKDGKLLSDEWFEFDYVCHFQEGFAVIQRGDKLYNFIDKDGNILSKEWFNYLGNFHEGFAIVRRGYYLYNFIDKDENYLSKEWFNCVDDFHEGFAKVRREDRLWNFIDKKGNYLSNEWFKDVYDFHEGFAVVQREDYLYNCIGTNGKLLSDEWFKYAIHFNKVHADVQRTNGKWAKIDKTGKLHF